MFESVKLATSDGAANRPLVHAEHGRRLPGRERPHVRGTGHRSVRPGFRGRIINRGHERDNLVTGTSGYVNKTL
jgi:hypothetical protein